MKKILLTTGLLLTGVLAYTAMLSVAGAALRQPAGEQVFTLHALQESEPVSFPFAIAGTPLVAERTVSYEGPFTEADGDVPIVNGLALLLRNTSDRAVSQVQVILEKQEQLYFFDADHIPPMASVLLFESKGALWSTETFDCCTGTAEYDAKESLPETALQIEDADMGGVLLTNLTQKPLKNLQLYYKNYLPETELYVGGKTLTKGVDILDPGETVYLPLEFYASGYSRIIKAQADTQ